MNFNELFIELYTEKYGEHITHELARQIVLSMPVVDESDRENGEKWSMEESFLMAEKVAVDLSKINKCEWYIVLNMMYSDYYRTAKKHSLPDIFFAELAHDWFYDIDGDDHKTFRYFMHF